MSFKILMVTGNVVGEVVIQ